MLLSLANERVSELLFIKKMRVNEFLDFLEQKTKAQKNQATGYSDWGE